MSENSQKNSDQSSPPSSDPQTPVAAQPPPETAALGANESNPQDPAQKFPNSEKIEILLKPVGDAPIMKQKKWKLDAQQSVGYVINWVRRYLKMERDETLFFYINQAFAPAPDQTLKNLYECFGAEGKLVLHYSKVQAWG